MKLTQAQRQAIMWLIAALVFALGILICLAKSPTQGAGAADLLKPHGKRQQLSPGEPSNGNDSAPVFYPVFHFAATATDTNGLESDFSNEAIFEYTSENPGRVATLAWDPSPGTNVITNYTIYFGRETRTYTNAVLAGTNLTYTVRFLPALKTNVIVTVRAVTGTGLVWALSYSGHWWPVGSTTWTETNPVGPRYWRAVGKKSPGTVEIKAEWQ